MRRIEFIAPVDAMRGNLSGDQVLEYAENNNPAWDAPAGKQFAKNYQPRYIGAKRSASGLKYFSTKTRNAVNNTTTMKLQNAAFGGACALYVAITQSASSAIIQTFNSAWNEMHTRYPYLYKSAREFAMEFIIPALKNKSQTIWVGALWQTYRLQINNPWVTTPTTGIDVSDEIIFKFWLQLAPNGFYFSIDGAKGTGRTGMTWNEYAEQLNALNIEFDKDDYVLFQSRYVIAGTSTYQSSNTAITEQAYTTTSDAPA